MNKNKLQNPSILFSKTQNTNTIEEKGIVINAQEIVFHKSEIYKDLTLIIYGVVELVPYTN